MRPCLQQTNKGSGIPVVWFPLDVPVECALTLAPPEGWWIMILELGSEWRMPGLPAARSREPMLAACPTHHVQMGFRMYCIVS